MKRIDRSPYILEHYQIQTAKEIAKALRISPERVCQLCKPLGVKPITDAQRRVNMIREANGELTIDELARKTGLCRMRVFQNCHRHQLPYKKQACGGFREGHNTGKRRAGRPMIEPPPIPDAPKKIARPAAVYSNTN